MIYSVWKKQGWRTPEVIETFNPDRCMLKLIFRTTAGASIKNADNQSSIKNVDNQSSIKNADKNNGVKNDKENKSGRLNIQREKILEYLKSHNSITSKELHTFLNLESSQARKILREMAKDGILIAQGGNRNRKYILNPVH